MKVKLINIYWWFFEYQQKKPIFGQFETFEQIHLHFSAISKLAEKYSFGKLYLEVHHLLSYYVSMYHLGSYQKYHTKLLALFFKMCFFYVSFIPFFVFGFWSLLATKLQKCYVIFVYILQGKMDKTEKNRKENHTTKETKIPKTKRRKYGMNET